MKITSRITACAVALVLASGLATAATETFQLDANHSSVSFRIRHLVGRVTGNFTEFSGTMSMDPEKLDTVTVSVDIKTASVDTRNADRDKHLRGEDFFSAEKFPDMKFESTKFVLKGSESGTLQGKLTLLGVTKPVELEVEILGFGPDMWGGFRGGFSATGVINRKDFGMVWNRALDQGGVVLGDEVEIQIDMEAVRKKPEGS